VTTAARHNANKPRLSQVLWFGPALAALAAHAEAGRLKYPDVPNDGRYTPNWLLGGKPDEEYLDAAMRHLEQLTLGHVYDDETHTMHAAAVMWNMAALITCNYPGLPKVDPTPEDGTS
jgi:hypothetical protein